MNFLAGKVFAFLTLALPLGLYIVTLAPTYIPVDSAEFALCIKFWGICHPPGFPLYTLIGKIFTEIFPFGSLIYKANLLSAIFSSITVFLVYLVLLQVGVRRTVAFLLSLLLAVSAVFWEFALAADVFSFATFLITATLLLTFKGKPLWAFFALGLSASHFYISAVLFPILAWHFWPPARRASGPEGAESWRRLIISALVFTIAFFPQAVMYFRMQTSPEINWGHAQGLTGFMKFVRREEFGSFFLLANPVLVFSLDKFFKHFYVYIINLGANFGIILPILTLAALTFGRLFSKRKIAFLTVSLFLILVIQLILLSTIEPTGQDNPFQISKFYLSSFIFAVILAGIATDWAVNKFFGNETVYALLILAILTLIYLAANWRTHDFSQNHFSQNLVLDGLGQLPEGSIVITVSHQFYFGGLYEQKINSKFGDIILLYFPNEKNRDNEKYQPQLFVNPQDQAFINAVKKGETLGKAEGYILETIAKNLDKPIYILQGTFEEKFFGYLKPNLVPYGLWWQVIGPNMNYDLAISQRLLTNLKNQDIKWIDLHQKQQQDDALTYAVSYHSTAITLANRGNFDEAIELLVKSLAINPQAENLKKEIELTQKTKALEMVREKLIVAKDKVNLVELGNNYYTLGNFNRCVETFQAITGFEQNDAKIYNNLASCYASSGQRDEAKVNYQKALKIDPNLELAKKGLEALER